MDRALTFGSLFAGIGGFDLGFERAGMRCAWQVEIDPFCQKVLAKHWPDVKRYSDVRECGKHNLEAVDLICGGFPCQPHSVAGKRRGAEDDRDLWPEYRRIIAELWPRWVVAENVPGIRHTILDAVLSDLEGLGYTAITIDLPAVAFDARHLRHRIFIMGYTSQFQRHEITDSESRQHQPPSQSIRGYGSTLAHAAKQGLAVKSPRQQPKRLHATGRCRAREKSVRSWPLEPNVGRVADGVPDGVDRLRALGNAVVPQVAEWIGRRIVEVEAIQKGGQDG